MLGMRACPRPRLHRPRTREVCTWGRWNGPRSASSMLYQQRSWSQGESVLARVLVCAAPAHAWHTASPAATPRNAGRALRHALRVLDPDVHSAVPERFLPGLASPCWVPPAAPGGPNATLCLPAALVLGAFQVHMRRARYRACARPRSLPARAGQRGGVPVVIVHPPPPIGSVTHGACPLPFYLTVGGAIAVPSALPASARDEGKGGQRATAQLPTRWTRLVLPHQQGDQACSRPWGAPRCAAW